jgi:hypothetical protein
VAELADALDSKSSGRKVVGVRFPPLVLTTVVTLASFSRFFVPASGELIRLPPSQLTSKLTPFGLFET